MTQLQYNYWTGTNWVPQYIDVGDAMKTGWHIFHVVMCLMSFGLWIPIYLVFWISFSYDYKQRLAKAQQSIDLYYQSLGMK